MIRIRRSDWLRRLRLLSAGFFLLACPACSPLLSRRENTVTESEPPTVPASLQAPGPMPKEPAHTASSAPETTTPAAEKTQTEGAAVISLPWSGSGNLASGEVQPAAVSVDSGELPPLLPMPRQSVSVSPDTLPREVLSEPEPAPLPRTVSQQPCDMEKPLLAALQAYLAGRTEEAIQHLHHYQERDQQFLLRLFPILAQLEREGLHTVALTPQDRQVLLEALQGLSADLRQQAPLQIRQLTFCRRVQSFGKYEPVASNRFAPGEAVGLYCELENLEDQALGPDRYSLTLSGQLSIRNARGNTCWQQPIAFQPDIARSPRLDHFLFVRFRIPRELDEGVYRLSITLRDESTQRTCQGELPFRIVPAATSNP